MRAWTILGTALFISTAQTFAADDSLKKEVRNLIEAASKEDFEQGLKNARRIFGEKFSSNKKLSDAAISVLRTIQYNKSYVNYSCALKELGNLKEFKECVSNGTSALSKMTTLVLDYGSMFSSQDFAKCEMHGRLFEAELEFPPFEFLQGARLVDADKVNDCLLRSAR